MMLFLATLNNEFPFSRPKYKCSFSENKYNWNNCLSSILIYRYLHLNNFEQVERDAQKKSKNNSFFFHCYF